MKKASVFSLFLFSIFLIGCNKSSLEKVEYSADCTEIINSSGEYSFFEDWEYDEFVDPLTSDGYFLGDKPESLKHIKTCYYSYLKGSNITRQYKLTEYNEHGLPLYITPQRDAHSCIDGVSTTYEYTYPGDGTIHGTEYGPDGKITAEYIYDSHYKLRAITQYNPDGSINTRETADSQGRKLTVCSPREGIDWLYHYDKDGQVDSITAGKDATYAIEYSHKNDEYCAELVEHGMTIFSESFTLDEYGNTNYHKTYNAVDPTNSSTVIQTWKYDENGNILVTETDNNGVRTGIEYVYNEKNDPISAIYYEYNELDERHDLIGYTYTYDEYDSNIRIDYRYFEGGQNWDKWDITYDIDGDILNKKYTRYHTLVETYEYTYYTD